MNINNLQKSLPSSVRKVIIERAKKEKKSEMLVIVDWLCIFEGAIKKDFCKRCHWYVPDKGEFFTCRECGQEWVINQEYLPHRSWIEIECTCIYGNPPEPDGCPVHGKTY